MNVNPYGCYQNAADSVYELAHMDKEPRLNGKRALVIGCGSGYGLATRLALAFNGGVRTLGVMLERGEEDRKGASAGFYNDKGCEAISRHHSIEFPTVNADCFLQSTKQRVIDIIKEEMGQVDIVAYSVAAPLRTDTDNIVYRSALKPIGKEISLKTVDISKKLVYDVNIDSANQHEIDSTVKVMGGEDLELWIDALSQSGTLASDAAVVAYSYIGPEMTHAIYKDGTIGMAKKHMEATLERLAQKYDGLRTALSVNKAIVTTASSAIPTVPLYISILDKVMREKGLHEGAIGQARRLITMLAELPRGKSVLRLDDVELRPDIQAEVAEIFAKVTTENITDLTNINNYYSDLLKLYGFTNAADTETTEN